MGQFFRFLDAGPGPLSTMYSNIQQLHWGPVIPVPIRWADDFGTSNCSGGACYGHRPLSKQKFGSGYNQLPDRTVKVPKSVQNWGSAGQIGGHDLLENCGNLG